MVDIKVRSEFAKKMLQRFYHLANGDPTSPLEYTLIDELAMELNVANNDAQAAFSMLCRDKLLRRDSELYFFMTRDGVRAAEREPQ